MSYDPRGNAPGRRLAPGSFFGEVHNREHRADFLLSEASYEAGSRLPKHSHELAFFCLYIKGTYTERYCRQVVSYEPFTAAFHPPDETHTVSVGNAGGYIFSVEVRASLLERLLQYAPLPGTRADLHGGEMVWLMTRLFREYKGMRDCSPLTAEGLVLEMLAAAAASGSAAESREPAWLPRVVELLHSDFRRSLTLNHVAAEADVHPIHLSRVFRKFHGQTVGDYIQRLRVQFATRQLCDTETPLADIAVRAGFFDQSHFTRVFKQFTGRTPAEFRASFAAK